MKIGSISCWRRMMESRVRWWLKQGDLREAAAWAARISSSVDTWRPAGTWGILALVHVYLAQKHYTQAAQALARSRPHFDRPESMLLTIRFLVLQTLALHYTGEGKRAHAVAARLFTLTEPENFIR